jgi:hypothetical protein
MVHSSFLRDFAAADGAPPTARQLYQTFRFLLYDFNYAEEFEAARYRLADFTERWGNITVDTLLEIGRRFAPGQPRSEVDVMGERRCCVLRPVHIRGKRYLFRARRPGCTVCT